MGTKERMGIGVTSDKNDENSKTGKDEQYTKVIMGKI